MNRFVKYALPIAVMLLCSHTNPLSAQTDGDSVRVSHLYFDEEINPVDETDPEFGRFDAYEVSFSKGDLLLVQVKATGFSPAIVLIAPDDTTYLAKFPNENGSNSLTYAVEIPFAGEWLLVVRADTNAIGSYRMRAWWADVASRSLPEEADLCDAINFVIAHANADFYFITRGEGNNLYPNVQLPGAIVSRISPENDFVSRFYQGNQKSQARDIYSNLVGKLKFCNGDTWTESFKDWQTIDVLSGRKALRYELREKERDDYRSVSVMFYDDSANPTARNKFVVEVQVSRNAVAEN